MQCESESDGERQKESESPSESESESESECKSESETESEGESTSQSESERGAQRRENFAFAKLARAARRKFCNAGAGHRSGQTGCPFSMVSGARGAEKNFASDEFAENTIVRSDWVTRFLWYRARAARRKFCFCNPSARSAEKNCASDEFAEDTMVERRKACTKYFWLFFYETPNPVRGDGASFFAETNFASDGKFAGSIFWSGATGQAFWRRKIFASDDKLAKSIFWSGATGQDFWRGQIAQAMKSLQKVFSGIFFTKTRTPVQHFLFM